jgi:hypothetical protein
MENGKRKTENGKVETDDSPSRRDAPIIAHGLNRG